MSYKLIREEDFNTYTIKHFQCDELSDRATILSDYANPVVPKNALHAGWTATVTTTSSGKTVSFVLANDLSSWAEVAFAKGGDPGSDYFPLIAESEAVMTNDDNGDPTAVAYSESATPNTFPIRDDDGEVAVGTPTKSTSAVNKESLEDGTVTVADAVHAQDADFAKQIETDREIDDADEACPPIVFGTVGGAAEVQDGLMKFPYIFGKTIEWNQLVQNGNFESTSNWTGFNSSLSISDNICTFTASASNGGIDSAPIDFILGHKYLLRATIKLTTATSSINIYGRNSNGSVIVLTNQYTTATTDWQNVSAVLTSIADAPGGNIRIRDSRYSSDQDAVQVKNVNCIDLTAIYGAGNEPSTVAEFVRDFPLPYYAYNAGQPLSSKSASVIFRKRNQWDEEWEVSGSSIVSKNYIRVLPNTTYYFSIPSGWLTITEYDANKNQIGSLYSVVNNTHSTGANCCFIKFATSSAYGTTYNHDICIYINWETPGLPYVPYSAQTVTLPNLELRSAGSAYDVAYQQGGGKRRVGSKTFTADEDWNLVSSTSGRTDFRLPISGIYNYSVNTDVPNISIAGFETVSMQASWYPGICTMRTDVQGYVYISLAAGASVSDAQSTMSGKTLLFELATETDITIEENPGWDEFVEIDNFGTIEFTQDPAQTVPVPQAYFIRYTVNLVEFLDSAYVRADGDPSNIATQSDLSGKLDKVTGTTTYGQIYVKTAAGEQTMRDYGTVVAAGMVAQRAANGQIPVPTTPTDNDHATSKAYVDNKLTATLTQLSDGTYSLTFGV